MSKYQKLKRGLCAAALLLALPAQANVVTANQDIALSFTQPPRLSEAVLTVTQAQQRSLDDIYWPAAGLYQQQSEKARQIADLQPVRHQIAVNTSKAKQQWQALYNTLTQLSVAERVAGSINPDTTRITPDINPILNGSWHLQLPKRPTTVTVLGAVNQPGDYPWNERQAARDYIQQAKTETFGVSQVWVISPIGDRTQHPVAYWNNQHRDILPGSVIYLPLPTKAIKGQPISPNQHVLTYLQNRFIE
ncbi:capsule biosynthesis GfcC family protein [Salinivibrio socompensis]|uniref:capsule biosynthesis GfcC family protein n=1 Tax=Salinivibrio socompensis TaxID=1510206 RepID=UPI000472CAD7|nr:capsule biosynthesis GfcC family protein [Salinivibrio socompensis]